MSADQPISAESKSNPARRHSAHSELLQGPHFAPSPSSQEENPMPLRLKERMQRLMQELESIEFEDDQAVPETGQEFLDQIDSSQSSAVEPSQPEVLHEVAEKVEHDSVEFVSPAVDRLDPSQFAQPQEEAGDRSTLDSQSEVAAEIEPSGSVDSVVEETPIVAQDVKIDPAAMQPLSQVLESAQYMDLDRWRDAYAEYPDSEEVPQFRNWEPAEGVRGLEVEVSAKPNEMAVEQIGAGDFEISSHSEIVHGGSVDVVAENAAERSGVEMNQDPVSEQAETETDPQVADFQLQATMILNELRNQQESLTIRRKELDQRQSSMDSQFRFERLKISEKAREVLQKQKELEEAEQKVLAAEYDRMQEAASVENPESEAPEPAAANEIKDSGDSSTKNQETQSDSLSSVEVVAGAEEPSGLHLAEYTSVEMESDEGIESLDTEVLRSVQDVVPDLEFAMAVKRHVENMEDAPENPIFSDQEFESKLEESVEQEVGHEPENQVSIKMESFERSGTPDDQRQYLVKERQLKKQHALAIQSMQQQKRRLQLLRSILVQQQEDWGIRAQQLETEQVEWTLHLQAAKEDWVSRRQEGERFAAGQQLEIDQQGEMQKQREASLMSLERKLADAQIQVFRDRTVVKQMTRAARKTFSNNDWVELKENIAREAEDFLTTVENQAREVHFQTVQHQQRLQKREEEVEAYRLSTQKWVERQNKLISRRAAHLEQREQEVQQKLQQVAEARRELLSKQAQLNEIIEIGLEQIEDEITDFQGDSPVSDAA